jgi:8-oxo-dGTP pyrophosphatase MutT (NUDIX family)
MTRKHGPWTIKETTQKYRHKLMEVYEDQVIKPDGSHGIYATVKVNPGVSVLALDEDGAAYLAREFRYAIGANSLEVVSGAIDDGEQPIDSARRELKEELGIEAGEWTELGRVDPITSIINSPSSLFLARDLTFKEKEQEGSERIEVVKVSLGEAVRMVIDSEITHGTSCVLILRAFAHVGKKEGMR